MRYRAVARYNTHSNGTLEEKRDVQPCPPTPPTALELCKEENVMHDNTNTPIETKIFFNDCMTAL